jgi:hypothetical protein
MSVSEYIDKNHTVIQFRRNGSSPFSIVKRTDVLAAGEPFFNTYDGKLYVGDGSTQLQSLRPLNVEGVDGTSIYLYHGT